MKGALRPWTRMIMGTHRSWARIGRGCASCMGAYGSWACMGRGRIWVVGGVVVGCGCSSCVGEGLSCPWALVIRGGGSLSSMGGALSSAGRSSVGGGAGGRRGPWALSLGCRLWALGIVCGRWVSFVGAGCCLCALGTPVGAGHRSWALGPCWLCVVGVGDPSRAIVVGRGVIVGHEVIVACFGGPGFQLG